MNEKPTSVVIDKNDILKLLVEAFKSGVTSYFELAESTCIELLENYVIEKSKTNINVTLEFPSIKKEKNSITEWIPNFNSSTIDFLDNNFHITSASVFSNTDFHISARNENIVQNNEPIIYSSNE